MKRFLVDTTVIVDVLSRDPTWFDWSASTHAAVDDLVVLTRDAARFQAYFPKVQLVTPTR